MNKIRDIRSKIYIFFGMECVERETQTKYFSYPHSQTFTTFSRNFFFSFPSTGFNHLSITSKPLFQMIDPNDRKQMNWFCWQNTNENNKSFPYCCVICLKFFDYYCLLPMKWQHNVYINSKEKQKKTYQKVYHTHWLIFIHSCLNVYHFHMTNFVIWLSVRVFAYALLSFQHFSSLPPIKSFNAAVDFWKCVDSINFHPFYEMYNRIIKQFIRINELNLKIGEKRREKNCLEWIGIKTIGIYMSSELIHIHFMYYIHDRNVYHTLFFIDTVFSYQPKWREEKRAKHAKNE